MTRSLNRSVLLAGATIGVVAGLTLAALRGSDAGPLATASALRGSEASTVIDGSADGASIFARIPDTVERVQPSIVSVLVRTDEGFSEGSGVVWNTEAGQIITNNHVVVDALEVEVALSSGERLPATVRATDPLTDLAVIEVDRSDLPAATFGDGLPRVGELAIALGNALGFENSVTAGIVSGLHRAVPQGGISLIDLVQTDAPISPGTSGGALVDVDGTVIGINVAAIPPTADTRASSIGFAIPAPTVKRVVNELVTKGVAEHAFLGIQPANATPDMLERFGLTQTEGVVAMSIIEGGAGERAGLQAGDLIVSFDGQPVRIVEDLLTRLRNYAPGDTVTLEILRGTETLDVTVVLAGNGGM